MKNHPASDLFPLLEGEPFEALKRDIKDNGQIEPIKLVDGMVLDGRNRMRACKALGIKPITVEVKVENPVLFAMSENYHRRHLDPLSRGRVEREALKRMGGRRGRTGRPKAGEKKSASVADLSKTLGIPERTIREHIQQVEAYDALPKPLQAKVDQGELTVALAEKVAGKVQAIAESNGRKIPEAVQAVWDKGAEDAELDRKFTRFMENTTSGLELWAKEAKKIGLDKAAKQSFRQMLRRQAVAIRALGRCMR